MDVELILTGKYQGILGHRGRKKSAPERGRPEEE